jgi:hypothetical protein
MRWFYIDIRWIIVYVLEYSNKIEYKLLIILIRIIKYLFAI